MERHIRINTEGLNDPEKLILWKEFIKLLFVLAVSGIITLLFG